MNKRYLYISLGIAAVIIGGASLFSQSSPFSLVQSEYVSADTSGLSLASAAQTVELKDGDTYDLTASYVKKNINGKEYRMLAYNGSIPGPLIKIAQGAEVTINLKNGTDMPTLLHSHGVRMDNAFDGSQTSQKEMKPGETFSYKLKFPDAGIYWYHPHVREDFEQELGLYGNYLVVPGSTDYWAQVNREVTLFLDDILIENGKIALSKQGADHTLMGRFGNVMLINGETNYMISAKKGEAVRFYVTNAANTRPFNFAIEGAKMKLVGADGGAYEKEQWVDSTSSSQADAVTLGPSERTIVEVLFENSGTFAIQNKTPDKTYTLGTVNVSTDPVDVSYASEFNQLRTHGEISESIAPLRRYFDKAPDKQIKLSIDMGGNMMSMQGMGHGGHMMPDGTEMSGSMMSPEGGIEWDDTNQVMNQMSDAESIKWKVIDQVTGRENMDIDWSFKRGEPVKIRIFNDPNSMHPMQHPMHFHGQRFLVLERNGVKETNLVWKDTVFIPSGDTVDILLDTSNPGTWMAHCHIAEHLEAGMMLSFKVE
ncbi:multicopper oxidase family protein [Candidatus Kaiserbacteria bacterium]|nr:multicopper oxidase family protein [Candidatus Kaiserbacteria bacterium]